MCSEYTGVWFIHIKLTRHDIVEILLKVALNTKNQSIIKLTKIANIGTLFLLRFIHDSVLIRVRFKKDLLLMLDFNGKSGLPWS